MPKRSFSELLTSFARVRAAWLDNAVTTMRLDDRYATAWLVGSLARGEEDVLSDIDMVAIFADDSASIVLADPNRELERFGHLLWSNENPYNAPYHGRFFTLGYDSGIDFCRL